MHWSDLQYQTTVNHRNKRTEIYCRLWWNLTLHVCSGQVPRISGIREPRRTPAHPPPPHKHPVPWAAAFLTQCWMEACARRPSAAQREVSSAKTRELLHEKERVSERWPPSSSSSSSKHRGPTGSHYGIVSRCHPAVVRNNGQGFAVPPLRHLQLDVVKCSARVVLSQHSCVSCRQQNFLRTATNLGCLANCFLWLTTHVDAVILFIVDVFIYFIF